MASPTITQAKTIEELARALGIPEPQPATEAEARFVIDELVGRERRERRARQRADRESGGANGGLR